MILFIQNILEEKSYSAIYAGMKENEKQSKEILLDFQDNYPGVMNEENIDNILERRQSKKESLLAKLNTVRDRQETEKSQTKNKHDRDER